MYLKSALKLQRNNIVPEVRLSLPALWNGLWGWKNLLTAAGILQARQPLSCCVFIFQQLLTQSSYSKIKNALFCGFRVSTTSLQLVELTSTQYHLLLSESHEVPWHTCVAVCTTCSAFNPKQPWWALILLHILSRVHYRAGNSAFL